MRFRFIEDHRQEHPVRLMCHVLGVSPSGYYAWRGRPESMRATANRALLADIRRLHERHRGRYGSPRIHRAWPDPSKRCRQSRQGCAARGGWHRQPRSGRAPDAPTRHSRRRSTPFPTRHHRQPPRSADRTRPARAGLPGACAEPGLAQRHHLHCDRGRLALPGPSAARGCRPSGRIIGSADDGARPGDAQGGGPSAICRSPSRTIGIG